MSFCHCPRCTQRSPRCVPKESPFQHNYLFACHWHICMDGSNGLNEVVILVNLLLILQDFVDHYGCPLMLDSMHNLVAVGHLHGEMI